MSYIYDLADTWNNAATTFTSIKMNVTDTASAAGSLLMDLQVGGSSKFNVSKGGNAVSSGGLSADAPAYGLGATGLWSRYNTLRLNFAINGSDAAVELGPQLLAFGSTSFIAWTSGALAGSSQDLFLTRRAAANLRLGAADAAAPVAQTLSVQSVVAGTSNTAGANLTITGSQGTGTGAGGSIIFQVAPAGSSGTAQNALATAFQVNGNGGITGQDGATTNTLALRNGTNAQAFRVYGTTDGTNSEFLSMSYNSGSNIFVITTDKAGSGSTRDLYLYSNSALWFGTGGSGKWTINTSGHLLTSNDNLFDIGASSSGRPRNVYVAGAVTVNGLVSTNSDFRAGSANFFYWNSRSQMSSPADGLILLQNIAGSDFGRLQFGGTTSSFPAIKRSSTTLQARLADDSGFASVQGKLTTDTAYTAGDPTTTGYLVVYDSAGVAYKIPAVAV